jgi:methanogen homocitrate synthase
MFLGKKSVKLSIKVKLDKMGHAATDQQINDIVSLVKAKGIEKKSILTEEEFNKITREVLKI